MGSGKRKRDRLEDILERPWCYYCERDFDDDRVLQEHQKTMHFSCEHCSRKLNTASGLTVHTQQVHKLPVSIIKNTIPGRESPDIEIFGMLGVPEDLLNERRQAIIDGYNRRAVEHRMRTGNPLPGTVTHDENKNKKSKFESKEQLKARVEARKAQVRAEKAARQNAAQMQSPSPATQTAGMNGAAIGGYPNTQVNTAPPAMAPPIAANAPPYPQQQTTAPAPFSNGLQMQQPAPGSNMQHITSIRSKIENTANSKPGAQLAYGPGRAPVEQAMSALRTITHPILTRPKKTEHADA